MTDPAIEAAGRAFPTFVALQSSEDSAASGEWKGVITAAREALKPIRGLHVPFVVRSVDDEQWTECEACCGGIWPCPTAQLIYTSEELA